jgi:predicted GNAT family N-acyltransferase
VRTILRIRRVSSKEELARAFAIRRRVFVQEQGVPRDIEIDRDDQRALHFLAFNEGKAVGTARVVLRHRTAKIGRMAVLKSFRGKGVGKKLLRSALTAARRRGAQTIYLHAQVAVIGFYEAVGFRRIGQVFREAGIPHSKMTFHSTTQLGNARSDALWRSLRSFSLK